MIIFETERLRIKALENKDKHSFIELCSKPEIIDPIPQPKLPEKEVLEKFSENLNLELSSLKHKKCICGIFEKGNSEMIGLALFLINEENENELGYRFKVPYWRKGYGTEVTKGMLHYYFKTLKVPKVTADVAVKNVGSVKILSKFMKLVKEFFNEKDNCIDRKYEVKKEEWLQQYT